MLIATANLNPSQAIVDHHCVVKPEDISRWLCEVPAKAILSTLRLKRLAASCSIVQNKKIWAKTKNMNKNYEQNMNKNMSKNNKYEQKIWTRTKVDLTGQDRPTASESQRERPFPCFPLSSQMPLHKKIFIECVFREHNLLVCASGLVCWFSLWAHFTVQMCCERHDLHTRRTSYDQ